MWRLLTVTLTLVRLKPVWATQWGLSRKELMLIITACIPQSSTLATLVLQCAATHRILGRHTGSKISTAEIIVMLFIIAKYKTSIIDCLMEQFYAKWMKTPGIVAQICNPSSWECLSMFQEWSSVRILSACEKTSRSQGKSLWSQSLQKHETVLGVCFRAPPKCSRQESFLQITHYNC